MKPVNLVRTVSWAALFGAIGAGALCFPWSSAGQPLATDAPPDASPSRPENVPVVFVPNLGQWQHSARFVAQLGATTAFLEDDGVLLNLVEHKAHRGAAVRLRFADAGAAELIGEGRAVGHHDYFLGNDPSRWQTEVPLYAAVRCQNLYPGAEVRWYAKAGHLEYDLELAPGAELSRIEIEVQGAERLWIDEAGALVIETSAGPLRQPRPLTWESGASGERRELPASYVLRGRDRFGFAVPDWSGAHALVLDPGLVYSTFLGGSAHFESAVALASDATGVVTIAGETGSTNYPTTPGAWSSTYGGGRADVFVARLDPSRPASQQLLYSTFVGGGGFDIAYALSVDATGAVTIAGETDSADYPTTAGAWDASHNGGLDVFVTHLDPARPAAQQLVYSTFIGGSDDDTACALTVDAAGVVTIAGRTSSADLPTTLSAWERSLRGLSDVFVTRLDPVCPAAEQLVYSTFIGGNGYDSAHALSVDADGVVTITGETTSAEYPTTPGAWATTHGGLYFYLRQDVFVTRLDPSQPPAEQLLYSTFIGGIGLDRAYALSVDADGVVTIAGSTTGDYPTTSGAWDTSYNGRSDVFVTRLDPAQATAQQLVYSTYLGGTRGTDRAFAVAVDAAGVVTIAGETWSSDFPATPGAWDTSFNYGRLDVFVTRLDPARPAAQQLLYSTFVGAVLGERALALAVDVTGVVTIAGWTDSGSLYPTTPGAWQTTNNWSAAFVTRLDMLPTGARLYGVASSGCTGPVSIGVSSWPQVGNSTFSLTSSNAPSGAVGVLVLGASGLSSPIVVLGAELWIDPSGGFVSVLGVHSNSLGAADFPLPVPAIPGLAGVQIHAQWLWAGPSAPPPCPRLGVSASGALEVTFQP